MVLGSSLMQGVTGNTGSSGELSHTRGQKRQDPKGSRLSFVGTLKRSQSLLLRPFLCPVLLSSSILQLALCSPGSTPALRGRMAGGSKESRLWSQPDPSFKSNICVTLTRSLSFSRLSFPMGLIGLVFNLWSFCEDTLN